MEHKYILTEIGAIRAGKGGFRVGLEPQYWKALQGLEGFSHLQVLWWFSGCDNPACRGTLTEGKPYANGPEALGVFATRSPQRPNPIAISCARMIGLDPSNGVVELDYLDADDGSPVLDMKPYTPSLDRVERPATPGWCAHWPKNVETSGDFLWEKEFNF